MAIKSTLRYPISAVVDRSNDEPFPTEAVDYIHIQRSRIKYKDTNGGYKGMNMPGSESNLDRHDTSVYLAMPKNISTAYQASYSKVNMGVAGVMASSMLAGGQTFDSAASTISNAAKAATPEVAASAIAGSISSLNQLLGGEGQVSKNDLLAVSQGRVFNPFAEQIFKEMQFRTHSFSFKLFSRSMNEAKEIHNIITYLKQGTAPILSGVKEGDFLGILGGPNSDEKAIQERKELMSKYKEISANRFFDIPDKYELRFVRYDPEADTISEAGGLHFRIKPSVCTGITVNYTPDGQYSSFQTVDQGAVSVPAIQLDMQFTETSVINQKSIAQGF